MNGLQQLINQLCPNGVEWKTLGEVCEIKGRIGFRGYTRADQVEKGEGVISLSPANIIDGRLNYDDCTYITYFKYDESPEIKTYNGDIIFCKTASVGKIGLVENLPCEATINPQLVVLKEIKSNSRFLFYLLSANKFQSKVKALAGIGSVPNIGQAKLESIQIPLPPLAIQSRIVEILDHFTNLTANLTAELALRRKQFEHFREKLLSLDGVEGVEKGILLDMLKQPITDGPHETPKFVDEGIPFLSAEAVVNSKIDFNKIRGYISEEYNAICSKKYRPQRNDVYVVKSGSTVGKIAMVDFDTEFNIWSPLAALRVNDRNSARYLFYLLLSDSIQNQIQLKCSKGSQPNLSMRVLEKFEVSIPPLAVQQSIVAKLDKFTALIQNIENELALRQKQYEYYREKLLSFPSPSL